MADEIVDGVNEVVQQLLDKVIELDFFDLERQRKRLELRTWMERLEGERLTARRSLARQFDAAGDMPEDKGGSVDLEGPGTFEVEETRTGSAGTGSFEVEETEPGSEGTGTFDVEESGTIGGEEDFLSDIDSQGQLEIDMSSDKTTSAEGSRSMTPAARTLRSQTVEEVDPVLECFDADSLMPVKDSLPVGSHVEGIDFGRWYKAIVLENITDEMGVPKVRCNWPGHKGFSDKLYPLEIFRPLQKQFKKVSPRRKRRGKALIPVSACIPACSLEKLKNANSVGNIVRAGQQNWCVAQNDCSCMRMKLVRGSDMSVVLGWNSVTSVVSCWNPKTVCEVPKWRLLFDRSNLAMEEVTKFEVEKDFRKAALIQSLPLYQAVPKGEELVENVDDGVDGAGPREEESSGTRQTPPPLLEKELSLVLERLGEEDVPCSSGNVADESQANGTGKVVARARKTVPKVGPKVVARAKKTMPKETKKDKGGKKKQKEFKKKTLKVTSIAPLPESFSPVPFIEMPGPIHLTDINSSPEDFPIDRPGTSKNPEKGSGDETRMKLGERSAGGGVQKEHGRESDTTDSRDDKPEKSRKNRTLLTDQPPIRTWQDLVHCLHTIQSTLAVKMVKKRDFQKETKKDIEEVKKLLNDLVGSVKTDETTAAKFSEILKKLGEMTVHTDSSPPSATTSRPGSEPVSEATSPHPFAGGSGGVDIHEAVEQYESMLQKSADAVEGFVERLDKEVKRQIDHIRQVSADAVKEVVEKNESIPAFVKNDLPTLVKNALEQLMTSTNASWGTIHQAMLDMKDSVEKNLTFCQKEIKKLTEDASPGSRPALTSVSDQLTNITSQVTKFPEQMSGILSETFSPRKDALMFLQQQPSLEHFLERQLATSALQGSLEADEAATDRHQLMESLNLSLNPLGQKIVNITIDETQGAEEVPHVVTENLPQAESILPSYALVSPARLPATFNLRANERGAVLETMAKRMKDQLEKEETADPTWRHGIDDTEWSEDSELSRRSKRKKRAWRGYSPEETPRKKKREKEAVGTEPTIRVVIGDEETPEKGKSEKRTQKKKKSKGRKSRNGDSSPLVVVVGDTETPVDRERREQGAEETPKSERKVPKVKKAQRRKSGLTGSVPKDILVLSDIDKSGSGAEGTWTRPENKLFKTNYVAQPRCEKFKGDPDGYGVSKGRHSENPYCVFAEERYREIRGRPVVKDQSRFCKLELPCGKQTKVLVPRRKEHEYGGNEGSFFIPCSERPVHLGDRILFYSQERIHFTLKSALDTAPVDNDGAQGRLDGGFVWALIISKLQDIGTDYVAVDVNAPGILGRESVQELFNTLPLLITEAMRVVLLHRFDTLPNFDLFPQGGPGSPHPQKAPKAKNRGYFGEMLNRVNQNNSTRRVRTESVQGLNVVINRWMTSYRVRQFRDIMGSQSTALYSASPASSHEGDSLPVSRSSSSASKQKRAEQEEKTAESSKKQIGRKKEKEKIQARSSDRRLKTPPSTSTPSPPNKSSDKPTSSPSSKSGDKSGKAGKEDKSAGKAVQKKKLGSWETTGGSNDSPQPSKEEIEKAKLAAMPVGELVKLHQDLHDLDIYKIPFEQYLYRMIVDNAMERRSDEISSLFDELVKKSTRNITKEEFELWQYLHTCKKGVGSA